MIYVFDSGPLIVMFRHYYRDRFPTLWNLFDDMIENGGIISVREVKGELEDKEDALSEWVSQSSVIFSEASPGEAIFVSTIFQIRHFQQMINKQAQLEGKPVADPFVIAKAHLLRENGCVVTTEKLKPNAAQIPNVCDHFGVYWTDLEGFMREEGWAF